MSGIAHLVPAAVQAGVLIGGTFGVVKKLFDALDWLLRDDGIDALLRRHLDGLFDRLEQKPLAELFHKLIQRFVIRCYRYADSHGGIGSVVVRWALLTNALATLITLVLQLAKLGEWRFDWLMDAAMFAELGACFLLGTIVQATSLLIVGKLLVRASKSGTLALSFYLGLGFLLAYVAAWM